MKDMSLRFHHQAAIEIWEQFCKLHHELYELTCDEYQALLSGEIEALEDIIAKKEIVINDISHWESERAKLIGTINADSTLALEENVSNVTGLLKVLRPAEDLLPLPALHNLNSLLIDVITRIQEQNKRNQMFLNRAMSSLKELREGFTGKKQFTTYGSDGMTRSVNR